MCHTTAGWALNPTQTTVLIRKKREAQVEKSHEDKEREDGPVRRETETELHYQKPRHAQGATGC